MNADDDPDWEVEAREAEAEERKRKAWEKLQPVLDKTKRHELHPLILAKQLPGTRLVVRTFENEDDPLRTGPIEFTILDPATGKVLVRDRSNFPEPTEGTLVGSREAGPSFLPGKLKLGCWLVYEVGGKRFDLKAIFNANIMRIEIYKPGMTEPLFVLWEDD